MKDEAYLAWREVESYQVPMTEEGEEKAQQRWINFRKGWNAAIKECAKVCESLPMRQDVDVRDQCAKATRELES